MLSYRHAFHAGNHADILKHSMLMLILQSLQKKDKPYSLIDTHAGAGLYTLDDERALKTGEAEEGIIRLIRLADKEPKEVPEELLPYLDLCRTYAKEGRYPGSPEIMRRFLRPLALADRGKTAGGGACFADSAKSGAGKTQPGGGLRTGAGEVRSKAAKVGATATLQDKLILLELHNTEIDVLRINMKRNADSSRINIHHRDAYEAMSSLVPPEPKRGLLLMDPSYEVDSDYTNVIDSLREAHRRWTSGIICLWYPLLKRRRAETAQLKTALRDMAAGTPCSFMTAELLVDDEENETGLYGSGMAVINPPWHLDDSMRKTLPYLASVLGVKKDASSHGGQTEFVGETELSVPAGSKAMQDASSEPTSSQGLQGASYTPDVVATPGALEKSHNRGSTFGTWNLDMYAV
ncbi:MAG: 23S rRNA (adenine(2030)-N(6))-methyltransferase RlmJ [Treponemataceae bacterium]|nr:23S rRNA (adenine(2030)-N(6))-methyltransferase RlmJ [Treponemataceae bacterium]